MANRSRIGLLGLAVVFTLIITERLGMYFLARDKLYQLLFLDTFIFYALGLSVLLILTGKIDVITSLLKEDRDFKSVAVSILIGIGAGLLFAVFALGGALQSITEAFGGDYVPLSAIQKLDTARLEVIGSDVTPIKHVVLSFFMETFHVAAGEEILMAVITGLILAGLGLTFKIDSVAELYSTGGQIALILRGILFSFLHIFAYTGGLEHFSIGYFIPAFIGGAYFGILLYWRGLLSAIFAHGVYNFTYTIVTRTGWTFFLKTIAMFFIMLAAAYAAYIYMVKPRLAKLKV